MAGGSRALRRRAVGGALAALAALSGGAAAARAATLSMDGDTLVFTAGPGVDNYPTFDKGIGEHGAVLRVAESGDPLQAGAGCTILDEPYATEAACPMPAKLRIELGDGNDRILLREALPPIPVTVLGGSGNDGLSANNDVDNHVVLDGGEGDDTLDGYQFGDVLIGGPGNDKLYGRGGDDELRGGAGDDELQPDTYPDTVGNDIVDGGPGYDTAKDWASMTTDPAFAIAVSLDGVANDGRPGGEADNVIDIEHIDAIAPGHYVLGDSDDRIDLPNYGTSMLEGRGGKDMLTGGDGVETIDGGPGDDRLEGGYNHDIVTGGPGKDTIYGDETSQRCSYLSDCVIVPFGNDIIYARDGEADVIDCGVGEDKAIVDPIDVVSNCEQVDRGQLIDPDKPDPGKPDPGKPDPGKPTGPGKPAVTKKACKLPKAMKGLTVAKARAKAKKAKCTKVKLVKAKSKKVRKGRVIRATSKGKTATLVVSRGRR